MTSENAKRRVCSFSEAWKAEFPWIRSVQGSVQDAFCNICRREFSIREGKRHVQQHANTKRHKESEHAAKSSSMLTRFFPAPDNTLANKVAAVEGALCYHNVRHHLSYASLDCCVKLLKDAVKDTTIFPAMHMGRTKVSAIIKGALYPYALNELLTSIRDVPFCLGTDASNHGHRKLFPICLRYFTDELNEMVLDFYEDSFEDSASIKCHLQESLNKHGVDINMMTSYRADNASVNYGVNKSVFALLRNDEGLNLVKANCNDHMLHNCAKNALKSYSLDIENLVLKIYAEFSVSAKNVANLKKEFEDAELTYQAIVRHVITRWLTLFDAISRLLKNLLPIKTYFLSLGESKCPRVVWDVFGDQESAIAAEGEPTVNELKLYFLHSFMAEFHGALISLQSQNTLACHLSTIIGGLKRSLEKKSAEGFFGMNVTLAKRKGYLLATEVTQFEAEAQKVYDRAIQYLDKWFPPEKMSFYAKLRTFSLQSPPSLEEILDVLEDPFFAERCRKPSDDLHRELQLLQQAFPGFSASASTLEKWENFFKTVECPNLKQIFQVFASIPVSNAFVERVFSVMEKIWDDDRNRLLVERVRAELVVFFNLKYSCKDFFTVLSKNQSLLRAIREEKKYSA